MARPKSKRNLRDKPIQQALSISKLGAEGSFLTYAGILPLNLPDGTRLVILPDSHIPAHLRTIFWAIMQFVSHFKPHLLISIGDWVDLFAFSRFEKPLRVVVNAQTELNEGREVWDELMEASAADWGIIIMGNHEQRFNSLLKNFVPSLGGIVTPNNLEPLSVHNLMGFNTNDNVTFLYGVEESGGAEGGLIINNDFHLHHGNIVREKAAASPLADMDKWQWSAGLGHTHRMGMVAREILESMLRAYEFGHLVNPDHSYLAYANKMFINWHPGFAVAVVHNGRVHVQTIPILPLKDKLGRTRLGFVWDGKIYFESDR